MAEPIAILHLDEHLVVVNKPPGQLVVAAPGRAGPTLLDNLQAELDGPFLPVHRLDEDTTGALVVARSHDVRDRLLSAFKSGDPGWRPTRRYLALVGHVPSPPAGRIEARLDTQGPTVKVVRKGGKRAVTRYRLLERRGRTALLECTLETGRRNQIRAHLAAMGVPVCGDRKYGWRHREGERFPRPMLHAWRIEFRHPVTGAQQLCEALPPEAELLPPESGHTG